MPIRIEVFEFIAFSLVFNFSDTKRTPPVNKSKINTKISKQTNSSANEFLLASYRFSYQLAMQSQFIATIGKSALTVQQLPVHENDA